MNDKERAIIDAMIGESTQVKALALLVIRMAPGPLGFDFAATFNELLKDVRRHERGIA